MVCMCVYEHAHAEYERSHVTEFLRGSKVSLGLWDSGSPSPMTLLPEDSLAVCVPRGGKYKGQMGVTRAKSWGGRVGKCQVRKQET